MQRFIQLHLLTSYPPSNLNRDDLGRPKTAIMGGATRLRISSQSLKRAWRQSELFANPLTGHVGTRTKKMGEEIFKALINKGVSEKKAVEWAKSIAGRFGELEKKDSPKKAKDAEPPDTPTSKKELHLKQLFHFSPEEQAAIDQLVATIAQRNQAPTEEELDNLRQTHTAVDIALFGRMLASKTAKTSYNMEAAAQVAHAITVHEVAVEDDFFTAVDDLNQGEEELGAAHIGETEFGAGLYYLYICIDHALLTENLQNNEALVKKTLAAIVDCAAKIAPTGKQKSFASNARASYILAEKGNQQPRSLSVAFLKPVKVFKGEKKGMLEKAIKALETTRDNMNKVYGDCADSDCKMNAEKPEGSLDNIIKFVSG